jgi:archaemetzincin
MLTCSKALPILSLVILSACTHPYSTIRTIAIQPIAPYDSAQLPMLRHDLTAFFRRPVTLLPPITLPASYTNNTKGERYAADSIIMHLTREMTDSITQIVGFTHQDIYTTKRDQAGSVLLPVEKYAVWGIFGLGYCPGKASVISDYRLSTTDSAIYRHRLRTVLLHEVGHNLGLPHCLNPYCIMNDANETISTIDKSSDDYCIACRRRISL